MSAIYQVKICCDGPGCFESIAPHNGLEVIENQVIALKGEKDPSVALAWQEKRAKAKGWLKYNNTVPTPWYLCPECVKRRVAERLMA